MSASTSTALALRIREHTLRMVHRSRASHVGTCLSMADILAVLYADVLRVSPENPSDPARDRLLVSKGHGAAAVYAVLAERGFFPREWLATYCDDGSPLAGHVVHQGVPGVEASTGSLGHGLSLGCGLAIAGCRTGAAYWVFVILSDGECDEGAVWEAALFAAHHRLHNLTAIIDNNKIQSFGRVDAVMNLEPLADKWRAFNWSVTEVDGHDHAALRQALRGQATGDRPQAEPEARSPECGEGSSAFAEDQACGLSPAACGLNAPRLIIAHTVKGRGVSFMEDKLEWHYKSPTDSQLEQALAELETAAASEPSRS